MTAASPPASRQQAMVWGEQPGSKQRGKAQAGSVAVPKLSLAATRADVAERSQTAQQKQQRGGKAEASRGVLSSMLPSSMRAESEEGMAVPAQGSSKQLVHT